MPEVEVPALPEVKVTQNGRSVDTSAIDNYDEFMAYLMQAAAAAHLAKIRKYVEDLTPLGGVQNFELDVTSTTQCVSLVHPAQSLYVVNDGPADIFVCENSVASVPTRLHSHEQMLNDFKAHKLLRFFIWSAVGTIATARAKIRY